MNMLTTNNKTLIYSTVRAEIEPKYKILYIALSGSRARELHSPDSDVDIKVIVSTHESEYFLQKKLASFCHNMTLKLPKNSKNSENLEFKMEATIMDFQKAFKYANETNWAILLVLAGHEIYCDLDFKDSANYLRCVYKESKNQKIIIQSIVGQVHSTAKRRLYLKGLSKFPKTIEVKYFVECIYLVLLVRCLYHGHDPVDNYTIDKLIQFIKNDEQGLVLDLVALRKKDRLTEIEITDKHIILFTTLMKEIDEYLIEILKLKNDAEQKNTIKIEMEKYLYANRKHILKQECTE